MKEYISKENDKIREEETKLDEATEILKKDRLLDQKKILELERRIGYLKEEYNYDKGKLLVNSNVMGIDINAEETYARNKVDDIMGKLKEQLEISPNKDLDNKKFINKYSYSLY